MVWPSRLRPVCILALLSNHLARWGSASVPKLLGCHRKRLCLAGMRMGLGGWVADLVMRLGLSSLQRHRARGPAPVSSGDPSKLSCLRRPPSVVGDLMGPPRPGEDFGTVWLEAP